MNACHVQCSYDAGAFNEEKELKDFFLAIKKRVFTKLKTLHPSLNTNEVDPHLWSKLEEVLRIHFSANGRDTSRPKEAMSFKETKSVPIDIYFTRIFVRVSLAPLERHYKRSSKDQDYSRKFLVLYSSKQLDLSCLSTLVSDSEMISCLVEGNRVIQAYRRGEEEEQKEASHSFTCFAETGFFGVSVSRLVDTIANQIYPPKH